MSVKQQEASRDQRAWVRVMEAAKAMAMGATGGVDKLGAWLGKRPGVFRAEVTYLRPGSTAKLGLVDAMRAMRRTGDLQLLHAINLEFGQLAIPLPESARDMPSSVCVVALAKEFGELVSVYAEAVADSRVTNNEFAAVTQAWGELMVAGQALMGEVAAKNAALNSRQGVGL